jgi:hypothetical protein
MGNTLNLGPTPVPARDIEARGKPYGPVMSAHHRWVDKHLSLSSEFRLTPGTRLEQILKLPTSSKRSKFPSGGDGRIEYGFMAHGEDVGSFLDDLNR